MTVDNYRIHYYPNTERLSAREIRVIALGTGQPFVRKSQASTAWLIEVPVFKNEEPERFLFDLGTGAMSNFSALQIPFKSATQVFLSHLHSDHWGDFWAFWIGGWVQGRTSAIDVWGPTGSRKELGTRWAIENAKEMISQNAIEQIYRIPPNPGLGRLTV